MSLDNYPVIYIPQGLLRGQKVQLKEGGHYFSFQGIPYAKPPVGPRRFKVAETPEPWQGVRDALQEGHPCPQVEWVLHRPYRGNEDCLYLNVYTPKLSTFAERGQKPVMVWIHGGGFEAGSGDAEYYGPEYLLSEDVVLVTINYRLNIFGFINVDDPIVPANLGLKDQVAALRWVRANIEIFGGDANNVTIFGESAGSMSVHYHLLSPMSKGLFHKAILQSGTVTNPFSQSSTSRELTFEVAETLGCKTNNVHEVIKFLSDVPAQKLVETLDKFRVEQGAIDRKIFWPVVERNIKPGDEIFLAADPLELMQKRQINNVPCMIGLTSQESILFVEMAGLLKSPEILEVLGDNLEMQIPKDIISKLSHKDIAEAIKKFYLKNKPITTDSLDGFLNLLSDIWFTRGADHAVKILSDSSPVFYYIFDFCGNRNLFKNFTNNTSLKGACHFDEIGYLFSNTFFKVPEPEPSSREWVTMKRMVKMWTNFSKYGHPTSYLDENLNTRWPPYTKSNPVFMNISDKLSVGWDVHRDRMDFWNKL